MDCLTGVGIAASAAVTASLSKGAFEYNRDNFQADRNQRRRATVNAMSWRIDQAKLWREDVRDLISLTEYKMRMYLIVNVLLCGMNIYLWTEGNLPRSTPHWLMVGNAVSIGSSFNFLILSIWLAMYAAVSAQSYEVRLVTQMVRLPIPTWEELEAARTYGSEFEKLEARQMFRVPYVMGWQENLARSGQAPMPGQNSINSAATQVITGAATQVSTGAAVDPWGLEQSATSPELGCGIGADVARLRHISLVRHAAIQWQTYDGFARICMSIGVQQLMLAMIYYLLGYLFVEVHSIGSAVVGVLGFTIIAETILVKDTSLPVPSMRMAQFLLGAGPMAATIAAANWNTNVHRYWAVVAFLSHGLYFGLIGSYCRVRELNNGAWLPAAFRSVLFLDAFCWTCPQAEGLSTGIAGGLDTVAESDTLAANRPGVHSVRYNNHGRPVPVRVSAPHVTQDMRDVQGAPDTSRLANAMEARSEDFYTHASFLPPEAVQDEHHDEADSAGQGWSERLGPGDLPWRVFMAAIIVLVLVWLFAAAYALHSALSGYTWDPSPRKHVHDGSYQPWDTPRGRQSEFKCKNNPMGVGCNSTYNKTLSFLSYSQVMLEWPHLSMRPNRLSCDASGQMIVLSDKITLFGATVEAETDGPIEKLKGTRNLRAVPRELSCPALLGEGLDDVTLSCNSSAKSEATACNLFALHGHGRHITACPLTDSSGASRSDYASSGAEGATIQISDSWFENFHPSHDAYNGNDRSRVEKPSSVSVNPMCTDADRHQQISCVVVGTSHGRVVQLGQRSNRKNLIPAEVLHEERPHMQQAIHSSSVRAVNDRYLGVLHTDGHSIRMLDMSKGGLFVGSLDIDLEKPAISFCAGGGSFFVLTEGTGNPELWKVPIPLEFANYRA